MVKVKWKMVFKRYLKDFGIGLLSGLIMFIRIPYNTLRMIYWEYTSDVDNLTLNYKHTKPIKIKPKR